MFKLFISVLIGVQISVTAPVANNLVAQPIPIYQVQSLAQEEQPTIVVEVETSEIVEEPKVESSLVPITYDFLITDSCNESLNDTLLTYIEKVPVRVLNGIQTKGYRFELVENVAASSNSKGVFCGMTIPSEKRILIQAKESKFRRAVVHEIFHAYDDYLNWMSESMEFHQIFQEEQDSFVVHDYTSKHYLSSVKEFWAEACQEYIYHPDELKKNTPKTYEFVKKYID